MQVELERVSDLTVVLTERPGHATELVTAALDGGGEAIVVFSGDGGFNEALNGLEGARREEFVAERRRYEERFRALFAEGRERGELRTDLDDGTAALLALSSVNWAYTWLRPGIDTDALADRFTALLVDGMRGYATP